MSYTPAHGSTTTERRRFGLFRMSTWSHRSKLAASIVGAVMAGSVAFAATSWTVGLGTGSSGYAQSGSITNITFVATSSGSLTNLLYPGTSGDVAAIITNPNNVAVTITAINLPTNTTYANGYSNTGLTTAQTGCDSTTSYVSWTDATSTTNTSHTLATAITLAANSNQTIVFTNEAAMGNSAASACQGTYFKMPSLTGITATAGSTTATSFTVDSWS